MSWPLSVLLCALAAQAIPVPQDDQAGADNAAGGAGSSSSYNISTGGIVAIVVIVAIVAVVGIASAVLFYLAKKRGWEVRNTLKRMSRRFTGRKSPVEASTKSAKRGAVRMASPTRSKPAARAASEKAPGSKVSSAKNTTDTAATAKASRGPKEPMNVQDDPAADLKRWKAIVPPGWSVGGRRP